MEEERIGRDQLIFSRSFATPITTAAGMRQVLCVYGQQASARLAKHGLQAKVLTAFAATSHYNPKDTSYPSVCVPLPMPTADPVLLTRAAHALLPHIHEGIKYARAGIMVTDLRPTGNQAPLALFENPHEERRIGTLLEDVTRRYGRGSIGLGHAGIKDRPGLDHETGHALPPLHHALGRTPPRQSRLTNPHHRTTKEQAHMTTTAEAPTQTHHLQVRTDPAGKPLAVRHDGQIWLVDPEYRGPALVRRGRLAGQWTDGTCGERRPGQHRILEDTGPPRSLGPRATDVRAAPGPAGRTVDAGVDHQQLAPPLRGLVFPEPDRLRTWLG